MDQLYITDVALRDGLQNQQIMVATSAKLELIKLLVASGVQSLEATSFVSPKHVPQMADASAIISQLNIDLPNLRASVLVPNMKGLERACAAGVKEIAVVLAATEIMNQKNINMSLETATKMSEQTLRAAKSAGLRTRAYIAVAFDCPFEGPTSPATVLRLSAKMHTAGADEIIIADTIGSASPCEVKKLLSAVVQTVPIARTSVHFHDTRGMGLANAWAALEIGIRRFDASTGGIGGCPFAPGAAGNLATEDLVLMARQCGLHTNINLLGLLAAIDYAEKQLQRTLGGRSIKWLRQQQEKGSI
ncbi:hydroxymethylglutaryl-CoA lyase [Paralcaligenes ureilyticus]|uniref:Hydroxymethylglutaryl-CoA lyase n=1 Tax=Paralcaligenes ureilyticus TaxID=627131 RepID=A0A4R3LX99_9BURK|nr:hydroxymethylglutaryl-CoA lyase [Paralcaligenes ureilyticus]TCT04816.1 hydroxymethylglutaryl-CoA lyase [Paralcaligenes ureilyticus]